MRGYFGIGVEGVSKPHNVAALLRTGHAFGASFLFAIAPSVDMRDFSVADTSRAEGEVPFYAYPTVAEFELPRGCKLVGVELVEGAAELPSFRHPRQAAYVLGPERSSLSPALVARCDFLVRIPTRFAINLSVAGAVVMYDRMVSLGRFAPRPDRPGGPTEAPPAHVQGRPLFRSARPET